jgi:hypothetical protein
MPPPKSVLRKRCNPAACYDCKERALASAGALFLWVADCYLTPVRIEYLFAASITIADQAARKQGGEA